jgi:hypothetical protein
LAWSSSASVMRPLGVAGQAADRRKVCGSVESRLQPVKISAYSDRLKPRLRTSTGPCVHC